MFNGLHVKYPLCLSDFNEADFLKILKYKTSLKSGQWELSCFIWMDPQMDRQTHDEANSHFLQFWECV